MIYSGGWDRQVRFWDVRANCLANSMATMVAPAWVGCAPEGLVGPARNRWRALHASTGKRLPRSVPVSAACDTFANIVNLANATKASASFLQTPEEDMHGAAWGTSRTQGARHPPLVGLIARPSAAPVASGFVQHNGRF